MMPMKQDPSADDNEESRIRSVVTGRIDKLTRDLDAQAYTLEAVFSILLIITVTFFVAPSIATPSYEGQTDTIIKNDKAQSEAETLLRQHAEAGTLKSSILDWDASENHYRDDEGFVVPQGGYYLEPPPTAFGNSLSKLEDEHNVALTVAMIPESNASSGSYNPDRSYYLKQVDPGRAIGSAAINIVLYDNDKIQSVPRAHTHLAAATNRDDGSETTLSATSNYPIPEAADRGASESVYNVVKVRIIIHQPSGEEQA
jgi:hypothetical protein